MTTVEFKIIKLLNEIFEARKVKNTRYSLRSFARNLETHPYHLSQLLSGAQYVTSKMTLHFCKILQVSEEQTLEMLEDVEKTRLKAKKIRRKNSTVFFNLKENDLEEDEEEFNLISDWYNFVIFEMVKLPEFNPSPQWIASYLGIEKSNVQKSLDLLFELKLIKKLSDGNFSQTNQCVGMQIQSSELKIVSSVKKRQKKILEKALDAALSAKNSLAYMKFETMAIDASLISLAREKIIDFSNSLIRELEDKSPKPTHVFEFVINLFPHISKIENNFTTVNNESPREI